MASKTNKKIKKKIKKWSLLTKFIASFSFVIALLITFIGSYKLQENDKFELNGNKTITMNVGSSYTEPDINKAITCICFGKNVSDTISINLEQTTYDPNVSPNKEGIYYIVYQTSNFKFKDITRIRTIIINEVEINEDGIGD